MAAASIIIGIELGGAIIDLACYTMSAFVIGFGINTVKSFIEARGYKVKEGENADESKYQKNINQSYELEYNYRNKLENLGNVYFFSDNAKGMLSESFLPMGIILKGYYPAQNKPINEVIPIPEQKKPINEVIPIPEQKKPINEVFLPIKDKDIPLKEEILPNNNNISNIEIFDKSNNIQIAFFIKVEAENGDIVKVPARLLTEDGCIDLSKFIINIKHKSGKKEKGGWSIEDDTEHHGWGKEYKLKDEKGNRAASLDQDGKIVTK